ncbi:MAG: peptidylprolyl isomerase [bacterium]
MRKAKSGDKVKIHFIGKLEDGSIFSTSKKGEPIEFVLGESKIISGIQEAVIGMEPQKSKTVQLPPDKGFGPHRQELIKEVDKKYLPEDEEYEVGQILELPQTDGRMGRVKVTDVSESKVTLDMNHPLAGQNLVFDITLLEIL